MTATRPVPMQADEYLHGLQIDLAAKRAAAFSAGRRDAEIRAAMGEWRGDQPHLLVPRLGPPIRSNTPRAGESGYEREAVAPDGRMALALCVIVVCGVVLAGLVIAGLRWRAGVAW